MRRSIYTVIAVMSLMLVVVGADKLVLAAPGGNSGNAKLCQKDGWRELARFEDPATPFLD